ncbi:MAG: hypothetical protein FWF51_02970 [Chitinivibrionia bacterium]|nr:hypothetical protein [Chitinivibrionia bacterium]
MKVLTQVRRIGLSALKKALGAVGTVRFIQQFDSGSGDYTKEKYRQPNFTLDEIDAALKIGK